MFPWHLILQFFLPRWNMLPLRHGNFSLYFKPLFRVSVAFNTPIYFCHEGRCCHGGTEVFLYNLNHYSVFLWHLILQFFLPRWNMLPLRHGNFSLYFKPLFRVSVAFNTPIYFCHEGRCCHGGTEVFLYNLNHYSVFLWHLKNHSFNLKFVSSEVEY